MIDLKSLAKTLDAANEALFSGKSLSQEEKEQIADWIVDRQWRSGPHTGLFAPTETDEVHGVRLVTGEKLRTRLAVRNILAAEAIRAIKLFGLALDGLQEALELTQHRLQSSCFAAQLCVAGECAHSSVGWMRYLVVSGTDDAEGRLNAHLNVLSQNRDGKGRWKRFPFYYTLLALSEINLSSAIEEKRYAAPACERILKRQTATEDRFSERRQMLLERILQG